MTVKAIPHLLLIQMILYVTMITLVWPKALLRTCTILNGQIETVGTVSELRNKIMRTLATALLSLTSRIAWKSDSG